MKKWNVTIEFTIQAINRRQAWRISEAMCDTKLRGLATVMKVSSQPLPDKVAEGTIAINESIGVGVIS